MSSWERLEQEFFLCGQAPRCYSTPSPASFSFEGSRLLVEVLPPEENLGAGETAAEWGEGYLSYRDN